MIGNCDACDRKNVPVSKVNAPGEPIACFICQGDSDPDPFWEEGQATLTDRLNDLRLRAFRSNSEADRNVYFAALSLAFQRGELIAAERKSSDEIHATGRTGAGNDIGGI